MRQLFMKMHRKLIRLFREVHFFLATLLGGGVSGLITGVSASCVIWREVMRHRYGDYKSSSRLANLSGKLGGFPIAKSVIGGCQAI